MGLIKYDIVMIKQTLSKYTICLVLLCLCFTNGLMAQSEVRPKWVWCSVEEEPKEWPILESLKYWKKLKFL